MTDAYMAGADVVVMSQRFCRGQSFLKTVASGVFHFIARRIGSVPLEGNASNFYLISCGVADVLRNGFRERMRFIRGLLQIVGFRRVILEYEAPERPVGRSKYTYWKQLKYAAVAFVSYTKKPLFLAIILSILFAFLSVVMGVFSIVT